jgi:CspA family cold shock protein
MAEGTVKWFNGSKGFGFIAPENGGPDLFVHHTDIQDYDHNGIPDNQHVEFELGDGPKGPRATAVRLT